MSYCRFSSDDWRCDVYVYCSAHGYVIHVAGRRHVFKEPLPEPVSLGNDKWLDRHQKVSEMLKEAELVDIGLPNDGESYTNETAGECADKLLELREVGYIVPQYAIDGLREEAG